MVEVVPPLQRIAADLERQCHGIWVYLLHGIPNDFLRTLNERHSLWVTLTSDAVRLPWLRVYSVRGIYLS
jgi:hypothetical protein